MGYQAFQRAVRGLLCFCVYNRSTYNSEDTVLRESHCYLLRKHQFIYTAKWLKPCFSSKKLAIYLAKMCGLTNVASLNFKNIFSIFSLSLETHHVYCWSRASCYVWNIEIMRHFILPMNSHEFSPCCYLRLVSCIAVAALKTLSLELSEGCTIFFEPLYSNLRTASNG